MLPNLVLVNLYSYNLQLIISCIDGFIKVIVSLLDYSHGEIKRLHKENARLQLSKNLT